MKCLLAITSADSELFINCGGGQMTIGKYVYQEDDENRGHKVSEENWAISSTGYFLNSEEQTYTASTKRQMLNTPNPELYTNARLSALSLKYYGLCLQNGNYTVVLHFAEIIFTDDRGRRFFDVFIQVVFHCV